MVKVFLVDDEVVIREGLRNSFPWEESGYSLVGEASDGEIALPMIRDEKPDILITDIRMPFMDGMQLCSEVKRLMPWICIIILSGHDDFNYARQAITLGVQEYLLKPISTSELRDVLDRISLKLEQKRKERESVEGMRRRLATGNRFVKEKLLSTLFTDPPKGDDAKRMIEQMRALGVNLLAKCYAVVGIAFQAKNGDISQGYDELSRLTSDGSVQLLSAANGARALATGNSEADIEERIYAFANSALYALDSVHCTDVLICVGETVTDFSQIKRSMQSANHIRHVVASRGANAATMRIVGVKELGDVPAALPDLNLSPLYERLQYASAAELPSVFSEYVASLGAIHSSVAANYIRVEALMTAGRIVREAGGDPKAALHENWYEAHMPPPESDDSTTAALELLRDALSYRDEHNPIHSNSSIAKARYYLAQRFSDPNLMLKDVAKAVLMSSSRFSTVFAQETGFTFTAYLTALRIGKAKELLSATAMRCSQIALAVGYHDPHYFSYLFKKSTGLTPGEYRKQSEQA